MKKGLLIAYCFMSVVIFAQEKEEFAYPINAIKKLPVIQGCEEVEAEPEANLECLKNTFEEMFIPYIKNLPKYAKDDTVEVYIEFAITKNGEISMPKRVTVSEEKMGDYVKEGYKQFRRDFIMNKTKVAPGIGRKGEPVNTLFAIRIKKRLR